MNKKIVFLALALVLPGFIFLFLKIFGKNQFDIPVYYTDGVSTGPTECGIVFKGSYVLPDSVLRVINWKNGAVLFTTSATKSEQEELSQWVDRFKVKDIQIILVDSLANARVQRWKNCVLFLKDPWKVVLMDKQKQIRGYYALRSREEMERLEMELEILFKKY